MQPRWARHSCHFSFCAAYLRPSQSPSPHSWPFSTAPRIRALGRLRGPRSTVDLYLWIFHGRGMDRNWERIHERFRINIHYITLYSIAFHPIPLHCITLHYIHTVHICIYNHIYIESSKPQKDREVHHHYLSGILRYSLEVPRLTLKNIGMWVCYQSRIPLFIPILMGKMVINHD